MDNHVLHLRIFAHMTWVSGAMALAYLLLQGAPSSSTIPLLLLIVGGITGDGDELFQRQPDSKKWWWLVAHLASTAAAVVFALNSDSQHIALLIYIAAWLLLLGFLAGRERLFHSRRGEGSFMEAVFDLLMAATSLVALLGFVLLCVLLYRGLMPAH